MKLSEEQVALHLTKLSDWHREGEKWITRKYRFGAFTEAIRFVNLIADTAEEINHHPMISIDYRVVTLRLTTWSQGGLTELDIDSARAYDDHFKTIEGDGHGIRN
jgi:4a-hydroxytetrahydrobiopterin dehydratase